MKQIPVFNNTKNCMHLGGFMIAPGETRHIPVIHVPENLRPKSAVKNAESELKQTDLAKSIADILKLSVAKITNILPSLNDEDLNAVEAGEKEKTTPRIGVVNAIAAVRVERASQSIDGDKVADEFALLVAAMDNTELAAQDYPEESAFFVIVNNEKQSRAVAAFKAEYADFEVTDLESLKADYSEQPDYLAAIDELITNRQTAN